MLSDSLLDDLVVCLQQPQHAGFVAAHLAAEADHIGEHDRGQTAGLGLQHRRDSLALLCTPGLLNLSNAALKLRRLLG